MKVTPGQDSVETRRNYTKKCKRITRENTSQMTKKRMNVVKAKNNSLTDIQKEINKLHGENSLVCLSDMDYDIDRIPTGIIGLDHILRGGLPKGKIALSWGVEGGGKSAIGIQFAAQAQKYGRVVYIDWENALDPAKAENSGVNMDELFVSQPNSAEDTLEIIEMCLGADDVSAIIIDSVAAMATEAEIAGDFGDAHVAGLARLLSQGLRKINQFMMENRSETILFFINQQRENIGGYGPAPQKTTPGGKALKYYSATTMEVARTGNITKGTDVIGQVSQVTLKKSKFAPPFQKASFDIYFDSGISNESAIIDLAIKSGLITSGGGGWMTDTATGENLGQGKPNVIAHLEENPEILARLTSKLLDK